MVLDSFAALINRNIEGSARARELCAQLEGRCFAVQIEGFLPLEVSARIEAGQLQLSQGAGSCADATISGTPLMLLALLGRDPAQQMRSGSVRIGGDAQIAQGFQELLRAARPDLEEELSRLVGDVTAHQLGNLARSLASWGEKSAATVAQNVSEYLREESRDLITRTEADEFLAAVDAARDAADRLEARIARLCGGQP